MAQGLARPCQVRGVTVRKKPGDRSWALVTFAGAADCDNVLSARVTVRAPGQDR